MIFIEIVKFALFQMSKFKEKVSYTLKKTPNFFISGLMHSTTHIGKLILTLRWIKSINPSVSVSLTENIQRKLTK